MKRLVAILRAIHVRNTTVEWHRMSFFASLHHAEIKPLEEILGIGSGESEFDDKTEQAFEQRAQQMLREQRMLRNV